MVFAIIAVIVILTAMLQATNKTGSIEGFTASDQKTLLEAPLTPPRQPLPLATLTPLSTPLFKGPPEHHGSPAGFDSVRSDPEPPAPSRRGDGNLELPDGQGQRLL